MEAAQLGSGMRVEPVGWRVLFHEPLDAKTYELTCPFAPYMASLYGARWCTYAYVRTAKCSWSSVTSKFGESRVLLSDSNCTWKLIDRVSQ